MTPTRGADRWAEVLSAFDEVIDLAGAARDARLTRIGSTDPELRRAVEALLVADAAADARLARLDAALGSTESFRGEQSADVDPLGLVGRTVSHFRIREALAQGGMGIVYRADDTRLERGVALKFPLAAHQLDRRVKERFLHEAKLAGALDHPNLCGIYEAGETEDGHLFYAMPLYGGETLKARLAREGALAIADALAIAKQIAHGLSAAHRAGIVHRDLKPANVMLLPDGTVKILDFGLARAKDLSLTGSRTALGTVSYMAPEQVQGRPLDGRADLWALGVVLYEMLTGARPFEGEAAGTITHAIVHTEPVAPSARRADIPSDVERVVLTLLSKEPARRPAAAEDVATALAVIQVGRGAAPGVPLGTRGPTGRGSAPWAYAVPFAALVVAALGIGAWFVTRAGRATSAPRAVAVLPFADSSVVRSASHLAIGVSDAIGTELSRLRGVIVPSHGSVALLGTKAEPPDIAVALGASAVVMGTVRRSADRLQIDIAMAEPRSSTPFWTRRYDRPASEIVEIPLEATRAIVSALRVDVSGAERTRLNRRLATNTRAYELYLRGREAELRGVRPGSYGTNIIPTENVRAALSFYSQAQAVDPSLAVARGRLALMLMRAAATYDTTEARREQARLEAETALRLEPGLFEAHAALASYWGWRRRDVERAIAEWERALAGAPHRPDVLLRLADAYIRVGRWDDAVAAYERAMRADPRNLEAAFYAALAYTRLRRDEEGMRAYDRAIALSPDNHMIRVIKGHTYLRWQGTPDTLAAVLRSVPRGWDPDGMATWARYTVLRVQRRYADALVMLDSSASELSRDGLVYQPTSLMRAQCYEALGDRVAARAQYEAARAMLTDSVAARPDDGSIHAALGLVHASLGRKQDAVREADRAMTLAPVAEASPAATAFMGIAVEVFGRVGELDAAFERLELLLAMPAGREATVPYLRLWPGFDPLRADPRFDNLLARFTAR